MIFTDVKENTEEELTVHIIPDNSYFRCYDKLYYKIDKEKSLDFSGKIIRDNWSWFGTAPVFLIDIKEIKYANLSKT